VLFPVLDGLGQLHLCCLWASAVVDRDNAFAVFVGTQEANHLFIIGSSPLRDRLETLHGGLFRRCCRFPLLAAVAVDAGFGAIFALSVGRGVVVVSAVSIHIRRYILRRLRHCCPGIGAGIPGVLGVGLSVVVGLAIGGKLLRSIGFAGVVLVEVDRREASAIAAVSSAEEVVVVVVGFVKLCLLELFDRSGKQTDSLLLVSGTLSQCLELDGSRVQLFSHSVPVIDSRVQSLLVRMHLPECLHRRLQGFFHVLLLGGCVREGLSYHGRGVYDKREAVHLVNDSVDGALYCSCMLVVAVRLDRSAARCASMMSASFCCLCSPCS